MIPFYFTIKEKLLDESYKTHLITESLKNLNAFTCYTATIGNDSYKGHHVKKIYDKNILNLLNNINLKSYAILLMHLPGTIIPKHIDNPSNRNCILSIPLYPKINYPPTYFYKSDELKISVTCNFYDMNPTFLNTQYFHSLETFNSVRLNLQICFEENFNKIVDLYLSNKFFKRSISIL